MTNTRRNKPNIWDGDDSRRSKANNICHPKSRCMWWASVAVRHVKELKDGETGNWKKLKWNRKQSAKTNIFLYFIWFYSSFFLSPIKPKTKSKRKDQPKPALVTVPVAEPKSDSEPDDLQHDFDFDPVLDTETETDPIEELELKQEPELATPPQKTVVKAEIPDIKKKSGYQRKRTFECYRCSLPCSKLYELKTHISIFHPFEEPKKEVLNCPYCTKTTTSRHILSAHLRKVSTLFLKFLCLFPFLLILFFFLVPCNIANAQMPML